MPTFPAKGEPDWSKVSEEYHPDWNPPQVKLVPTDHVSVMPDEARGLGKDYPCPLLECTWSLWVPELEVDDTALASVFGLGVMASAAAAQQMTDTEHQLEEHLVGHTVQEWAKTVAWYREQYVANAQQIREMMETVVRPMPAYADVYVNVPAPPPPGVHEHEEMRRLRAENELMRSRIAQDEYDPMKATPTYRADLPDGQVGIRR